MEGVALWVMMGLIGVGAVLLVARSANPEKGTGSLKSSAWRGVVFVALVVGLMAMGRSAWADYGKIVGEFETTGIVSAPTVHGDIVYFLSELNDGDDNVTRFHAVYKNMLEEKCHYDLLDYSFDRAISPKVDDDGSIYIKGVAFYKNCDLKWREDRVITSHLTIDEDTIYAICGTPVCAINTSDGKLKWEYPSPTGGMGFMAPILYENKIFVQYHHSDFALDKNGELLWTANETSAYSDFSMPALYGDVMYYAGYPSFTYDDVYLFGIYMNDGTVKNAFKISDIGIHKSHFYEDHQMLVDSDTIYTLGNDQNLYAINTSNGTQKWKSDHRFSEAYGNLHQMFVNKNTLYFSTNRVLFAFDATNGDLKWEFHGDSYGLTYPFVDDTNDKIYVGGYKKLYVLEDTPSPELGKPVIAPSGSTEVCSDETVTLTATSIPSGYKYKWYKFTRKQVMIKGSYGYAECPSPPGYRCVYVEGFNELMQESTSSTFEVTESGKYLVLYTDTDENFFSEKSDPVEVIVNEVPDAPTITGDAAFCSGKSTDLTASAAPDGYGYEWGGGETSQTVNITSKGNYKVKYTGKCDSDFSAIHLVKENISPTIKPIADVEIATTETYTLTLDGSSINGLTGGEGINS